MTTQTKVAALCAVMLFCPFLTGCQKEKIEIYEATRDAPAATSSPMMSSPRTEPPGQPAPLLANEPSSPMTGDMPSGVVPESPQAGPNEIQWTVPKGWQQQPASGMRIGSFLVPGSNGQQADVSIIPLAGEAGSELANVNRWRGQLNLGPISESDLRTYSRTIRFGSRPMEYTDLISAEPLIQNRFKKRIITATYSSNGRTWFFKMMGDEQTVGAGAPAFKEFLKTLKFSSQ